MKKIISFVLAVLLLGSICLNLAACGGCKHEWNKATGECKLCGEKCAHEWDKGSCKICRMVCSHEHGTSETVPCSVCGYLFDVLKTTEDIGVESEFVRVPQFWESKDAPQQGTIETVNYSTTVYEDTYDKYVMVYLPYGYDPNRAEPYNVVYFEHGNNSLVDIILTGKALKVLDNMFYYSDIDPVIIVSVTFYTAPGATQGPGFDRWGDNQEFIFHNEIVKDVIPMIEAKYNTYAKNDVSDEGLKATRNHRAFSGYSRGGMCTWSMFHYAFEYFEWYAPMSGFINNENAELYVDGKEANGYADISEYYPSALNFVKETVEAHPDLDFFIYEVTGGSQDLGGSVTAQAKWLIAQNYFSFGKDPAKNNFYVSVSDYNHGDPWSPHYYYNSLQVLFHE